MTMQMPIVAGRTAEAGDSMAPPQAPLHMPKQVLTAAPGALRRRMAALVAFVRPGRHRPG